MESKVPTLYIYSRVSSAKQAGEGRSGMLRQESGANIAQELEEFRGMPCRVFDDSGMSAHSGKNIDQGQLGQFVEACRNGDVASGSVLAMEHLDRFTRLSLTNAQRILNDVLLSGVSVYCWSSGQRYEKDDLLSAITAVLELKAANDYSEKIRQRVTSSALLVLKAIKENKRDADGHLLAMKSFGSNKWWACVKTGYVKPHPVHFKAAKKIIELTLLGWGSRRVLDFLNANQEEFPPPSCTYNKIQKGWGSGLVATFHHSRTLIGEKSITIEGEKHVIKDYYPKLCTPLEFRKIRELKQEKKTIRRGDANGLITGMGIAECFHCKSTIHARRTNSVHTYESVVYRCATKARSSKLCKSASIDSRYLETMLIKMIGSYIYQPPPADTSKADALELEIQELGNQAESIMDLMIKAKTGQDMLIARFDQINEEKELKQKQLEEEMEVFNEEVNTDVFLSIPPTILDYNNDEARGQVRLLIRACVRKIVLVIDKGQVEAMITLRDGSIRHAVLVNRKQYTDLSFDAIHATGDGRQLASYASVQNNWVGIDRKGNEISLLDDDWNTDFSNFYQ
ncbi:recombinase family protein [Oceanisphaera ostreae]|uniref:Recombinase family protein n=1 Tax=Oceanisphaera ostreae TaxID=914151 RepID=A0ABW3KCV5_9GAMM